MILEYRVTGSREYYGHKPGEVFEQRAGRAVDARAVARGDLEVVRVVTPELQPGHRLPAGWLTGRE